MSRLGLSLIIINYLYIDQILVELCRILFGGRMAQNYYLIYLPSKKWEEVASIASSDCKNGRYIIKYTRDMQVKAAHRSSFCTPLGSWCKTHLTLCGADDSGRDRAVQVHVAKVICIKIWVWVNTYRYIFNGMNIHLPAILGFTRYQGFDS